ncbi:MAG: GNAT family N-acetyltransferase [Myxococcota bacterium]
MPILRPATLLDALPLSQLAESSFRDTFAAQNSIHHMDQHCANTYSESIQAQELQDPQLETLLCEDEGVLIGFAQLRFGEAPACVRGRAPGELQRLYVARAWHGRGVAHLLMQSCLETLRTRGADLAWLGVWEHNPRAIAFYQKWGFEEVGAHVFMLGDDPQRDLVMVRAL